MRYLSVCSGIEAATAAWKPLGWKAVGFAEIEPFPSAVLKHHYPDVKNHGDFTKIEAGDVGPIDLLVGGTPCQSFSIAGLRGGLDDERGNLALEFLKLAQRLRPRWILWENVPGILSSLSHSAPDPCPPPPPVDMGCDGAEMDTEDEYDSEELHGFNSFLAGLSEIGYGFAYRILDAQYDGLAQRRERVFVVGYLGDWRRAAAVLSERESLSWNPPPCRTSRKDITGTLGSRTTAGGGLGTDFDLDGGLIAHALRTEGFDAFEDGTGRGTPIVPVAFGGNNTSGSIEVAAARSALGVESRCDFETETLIAQVTAYRVTGNDGGFETGDRIGALGTGTDPSAHLISFSLRGREGGAMPEVDGDCVGALRSASGGSTRSYLAGAQMGVRRITPTEAERLMGFSPGYTAITYRGKPAADGPRYRCLGNSFAVPVVRWIGERIAMVEAACLND
jgi:DNA (cytosine-5)-methyltransferase 1